MATLSPEVAAKIAILREKHAAATATLDDAREAITLLRENRVSASYASAGAKAKKAVAVKKAGPVDLDGLMGDLFGEM